MRIVVLDAAALGDDLDLSPLYAEGEVTVYRQTAPEEVRARIADCDAVFLNKVKIGREQLPPAGHEPGILCIAATGYDNIDTVACRERGIAVANVRGYSTDSVTQVTVGLVLALVSHLPTYCASVADGTYSRRGQANLLSPSYRELSGLTWGILGAGQIGNRVATVARAFGCRVLTCRRHPNGESIPLDQLLQESDILTVHTPLTDETRGLLGRAELARMKRGSILVNMARGAVTDEAAVAEAVLSGHLGGFGADVYSVEPFPTTHPFAAIAGLSQVCLTPHMSWGALEARERCLREMILNMKAFSRGEERNRV